MKKIFNIWDATVQSQVGNLIGDYPLIHPTEARVDLLCLSLLLTFVFKVVQHYLNIYVAYVT